MRFFQRNPDPERPRAGVFGTGKCDDCDHSWHPYYTCECGCSSWRERMQPKEPSRWTRRGFLHLLAGATAAVIAAPAVKMLAPEPGIVVGYDFGMEPGKIVRFARYDRLGLPVMPLTEGVVPTPSVLTFTRWVEPGPEFEEAYRTRERHLIPLAEPDGGGA